MGSHECMNENGVFPHGLFYLHAREAMALRFCLERNGRGAGMEWLAQFYALSPSAALICTIDME